MSEKHFTRSLSKSILSRLITCLTKSKVTQMLLNILDSKIYSITWV